MYPTPMPPAPTTDPTRRARRRSPALAAALVGLAGAAALAPAASAETLRFTPTLLSELADYTFNGSDTYRGFLSVDALSGAAGNLGPVDDSNRSDPQGPQDYERRAARWSTGGRPTLLGGLPNGQDDPQAFTSQAKALNGANEAAGFATYKFDAQPGDGAFHAVRWDSLGNASRLGEIDADFGDSVARAINASGESAGYLTVQDAEAGVRTNAVRWNAAGTPVLLGDPGEGNTFGTEAYAINDAGAAAGTVQVSADFGDNRAVRWTPAGTASRLGDLGDRETQESAAYALNTAGEAAGFLDSLDANGDDSKSQAVRWSSSGVATAIADTVSSGGTDYNIESTSAEAIDDDGRAVVNGQTSELGDVALLWGGDGSVSLLQDLIAGGGGWTLQKAFGIDTFAGVTRVTVLGGRDDDPDSFGYYLLSTDLVVSPVPEPLTALGGAGLLALVVARRPRRAAR